MSTLFSSIWPIDRSLSSSAFQGQRGPGSDGNETALRITGTSGSDCLISYPEHSLGGGSYFSAEKQSVYSIASPHQSTGQACFGEAYK